MGVPPGLMPHTVTRVRPATVANAYGDSPPNYVSGATRTDYRGWLQQNDRAEPIADGRDAGVQRWLLITNDAEFALLDRVEWTGPAGLLTFEVDGPPKPVYTPAGYHHTETTLKRVEG